MRTFDAEVKEKALTQGLGKAFFVLILSMITDRYIIFDDIVKFFLLFPATVLFGGWVIYTGENFIFYAMTSFLSFDKDYPPALIKALLLFTKFLCFLYLIFCFIVITAALIPEANNLFLVMLAIAGGYLCHITYKGCKKEMSDADNYTQPEFKPHETDSSLNISNFHNFVINILRSLKFEILYSEIINPSSYILATKNEKSFFILNIFDNLSPDFLKKAVDLVHKKTVQTSDPNAIKYDHSMLIYPRAFPPEIIEYAKGKNVYLVDNEGLKKLKARGGNTA